MGQLTIRKSLMIKVSRYSVYSTDKLLAVVVISSGPLYPGLVHDKCHEFIEIEAPVFRDSADLSRVHLAARHSEENRVYPRHTHIRDNPL